jgi:hypothetical protein
MKKQIRKVRLIILKCFFFLDLFFAIYKTAVKMVKNQKELTTNSASI